MGLKMLKWLLVLACVAALAGLGVLTAVCLNAGREWSAGNWPCR